MCNERKNILWVDDDVNKIALLPDRDELESKGFNIIPIDRVDEFLNFIASDHGEIACVILDMLMATGNLDITDTENGTRTGKVLYDKLKESRYRDVKVVVYSVHKRNEFASFGDNADIVFLSKDIKSSEFAQQINNIINNNDLQL